jgi:hypothetical protein
MDKAERAYLNDPMYKQCVDMLEKLIESRELTPSEIRECAMLACGSAESL